jgi:hypothetical protein
MKYYISANTVTLFVKCFHNSAIIIFNIYFLYKMVEIVYKIVLLTIQYNEFPKYILYI